MQPNDVALVKETFGFVNRGQVTEAINKAENIKTSAASAVAKGYALFRSGDIINGTFMLRSAVQAGPEGELIDILMKLLIQFELHYPLFQLLCAVSHQHPHLTNEQLYHLVLSGQATGNMADSAHWLTKLRHQATQAKGLDLLEGHYAKSFAQIDSAANAYRRFINECPHASGTGLWSLCDLKGFRFSNTDASLAKSALAQLTDPLQSGLVNLALSKVQADKGETKAAIALLQTGNSLLSRVRPFQREAFVSLIEALLSQPYNADRKQHHGGNLLFVCGLPRSGTTLIEQILASSEQVETTNELPFMERIALHLQMTGRNPAAPISENDKAALREFYLQQARDFATLPDGMLIDKNPNNFMHHQLITQLFPNAKVINILRPVTDNIIALYRQYFMSGNEYAYNIEHILTYIEGYYALLQHAQQQQCSPFIIDYEALVHQPQQEVQKLFAYCGLPYSDSNLNFYQQSTPVLTPSASQVRQPISASSLGSGDKFSELLVPYQARVDKLIEQRAEILANPKV